MFCPNCETENYGESRFCAKCASPLPAERSPANDLLDKNGNNFITATAFSEEVELKSKVREIVESSANSGNDDLINSEPDHVEFRPVRDEPDPDLWGQETVFAPSTEEDSGTSTEDGRIVESMFDDAQADDVFEQNMTRQPSTNAINEVSYPFDPARNPDLEDHAEVVIPETDDYVVQKPDEPIGESRQLATARDFDTDSQDPRSWRRKTLLAAGVSLVVLAIFAAGIATGMLFIKTFPIDTPPADSPVHGSLDQQPIPPPGMDFVPGGEFVMGSDTADEFSRPAHHVTVEPFFIDQTEVTNEDYAIFVDAAGHLPPPNWTNGSYPQCEGQFPVTGVSWYDAAAYAAWAEKRLPTEEEWEFAARGTDGRAYPWGNDWNPQLANVGNDSGGIRRVGQGARSPFGLFDMSGNVWEWTASDALEFPGGKPPPKTTLRLKIIRGGNWQSDSRTASAIFRGYYGAAGEREYKGTGFRCVRDLKKE